VPEGDTIHRLAARLDGALTGHVLQSFYAPTLSGRSPRPGETITAVEAAGKHLLIRFSGGLTLETHMRMTGTWSVRAPSAQPARRAGPGIRVIIETDTAAAICRNAPVVRTWRRPESIAHLGPDLCRDDADLDEVVARMRRADAATEIGVALLDQSLASGIGNVYKSEVLHARRVDPFRTLATFHDEELRTIVGTAAELMRANLGAGPRTTVPGGLAVYRRAGRGCPRCRAAIAMRRQGNPARSTYFCPACQPPYGGNNRREARGSSPPATRDRSEREANHG
jgi:endonuclease-8